MKAALKKVLVFKSIVSLALSHVDTSCLKNHSSATSIFNYINQKLIMNRIGPKNYLKKLTWTERKVFINMLIDSYSNVDVVNVSISVTRII